MSGKIRRIDYYPDEYISGVGGVLRADEQGVYWMVCSLIMSEGGAVIFDVRRMGGLCRLRPSDIKRIVGVLVERGKLTLNDGKLTQRRAQSEIARAAHRIQSASENGAKGGRPKGSSGGKTSPNLTQSVGELDLKCEQSVPELNPKCEQKTGKMQQKQPTQKADGFSGEKLTTNYQLATEEVVDANASTVRRVRGTRISAEWKARENERQWARDNGWPEDEVDDVETRFRDYWLTRVKDATKIDWDRTFLNRLKDVNDRRKRAPPLRNGNGGLTTNERQMRAFEDEKRERQQGFDDRGDPGVVHRLPFPGTHRQ